MLSPTIIRQAIVGDRQYLAITYTGANNEPTAAFQIYDAKPAATTLTSQIHSELWSTERGVVGAFDRAVENAKTHADDIWSEDDLEDENIDPGRYTLKTWARDEHGTKLAGFEREYSGRLDPQDAAANLEALAWDSLPVPDSVDTPTRVPQTDPDTGATLEDRDAADLAAGRDPLTGEGKDEVRHDLIIRAAAALFDIDSTSEDRYRHFDLGDLVALGQALGRDVSDLEEPAPDFVCSADGEDRP